MKLNNSSPFFPNLYFRELQFSLYVSAPLVVALGLLFGGQRGRGVGARTNHVRCTTAVQQTQAPNTQYYDSRGILRHGAEGTTRNPGLDQASLDERSARSSDDNY